MEPTTNNKLLEEINEGIKSILQINRRLLIEEQTYLSITEAAEYIQIPKATLYQYVSKGLIPYIKMGRHDRFLKASLDSWMQRKEVRHEFE